MTEEDIDAILEAGQKRTEELNKRLEQSAAAAGMTGDLLDFSLDSANTQVRSLPRHRTRVPHASTAREYRTRVPHTHTHNASHAHLPRCCSRRRCSTA